MSRTVYLNGEYLPEEEAKVSIFDRGFVMGDAVYEVTSVLEGKILEFEGHLARLSRSMAELQMTGNLSREEWLEIHRQLIARNNLVDGMIYLQVSRGNAGDRDFHFPPAGTPPTIVLYTQSKPGLADDPKAKTGIKVVSIPDLRWHRRDIKTVQLLYPSMAKMAAEAAGKHDAWFVEDGFVTEGSSNNVYIVKGGKIITRQNALVLSPPLCGCGIFPAPFPRGACGNFGARLGFGQQARRGKCSSARPRIMLPPPI